MSDPPADPKEALRQRIAEEERRLRAAKEWYNTVQQKDKLDLQLKWRELKRLKQIIEMTEALIDALQAQL